jgi:hypothetical protein
MNKTNAPTNGKNNNFHPPLTSCRASNVANAVREIRRYAPNAFTNNIALSNFITVNKSAIGSTKTHFQIKPKTILIIPRKIINVNMLIFVPLNDI